MRTTLTIDDDLFAQVQSLTRAQTKAEAIREALEAFVQRRRKERLLALKGKLDIDDAWADLRAVELREMSGG